MSIYSKTGDTGETSLIGGRRLPKDDIQIASYGVIDELSSEIGLLVTYCSLKHDIDFLQQIQRDLFLIGGYLASDWDVEQPFVNVSYDRIKVIENEIDAINSGLTSLNTFILPGGSRSACIAHACRTICRRAERKMVAFLRTKESLVDNVVLVYINRLSDYFFVLARRLNIDEEVNEITW